MKDTKSIGIVEDMNTQEGQTQRETDAGAAGRFEFPLATAELGSTLKRDRTNAVILVVINLLWIILEVGRQNYLWTFVLCLGLFVTVPRVLKAVQRVRSLRDENIWLDETSLWLPMVATDQPSCGVPISEICLIEQRWATEDKKGALLVGTKDLTAHIPDYVLKDPTEIHGLASLLINRVCQDPDGRKRLADGQAVDEQRRARYGRRPGLTMVIMVVITAVYMAELITGAMGGSVLGGDPFELIRMGANVPPLVLGGEWDRMVTATFMHGGWIHLALNGLALLGLGAIVENTMGTARFAVVYGVSAIGASLASTVWSGALMSVGASGAIFGLLGALAVLQLCHSELMPPRLRQSRRWWIIILAINSLLPILIPQIDFVAHGVGFVIGALTAWLVSPKGSLDELHSRPPIWVTAMAICLGVVTVGAVSARATQYSSVEDVAPRFMTQVSVDDLRHRVDLNNMAWILATTDQLSIERLHAARAMMDRIVALEPLPAYQDTLATLCFRTGEAQRAIAIERQVLNERDDNFTASQVLRFMVGAIQSRAPASEVLAAEDGQIRVRLTDDPGGPEAVFWGVFDGEVPYGLLRVKGSGATEEQMRVEGDPIKLKSVDFIYLGRFKAKTEAGSRRAKFWRYDSEADALPPGFRRPRP